MNSLSILDAWTSFAAAVIPLDAPPAQHADMRRAFYTGAVTILEFTEVISNTTDDALGMYQGIRMLERLHVEKRAFIAEMERLAREP